MFLGGDRDRPGLMPLAGDRIGDPLGDAEEHENGIAALLGAILF